MSSKLSEIRSAPFILCLDTPAIRLSIIPQMLFPLIVGIAARIVTKSDHGPRRSLFPGGLMGIKIVIAG